MAQREVYIYHKGFFTLFLVCIPQEGNICIFSFEYCPCHGSQYFYSVQSQLRCFLWMCENSFQHDGNTGHISISSQAPPVGNQSPCNAKGASYLRPAAAVARRTAGIDLGPVHAYRCLMVFLISWLLGRNLSSLVYHRIISNLQNNYRNHARRSHFQFHCGK